jgi:hypothetical protein
LITFPELTSDLLQGKTTFLWYYLIRALSARQPILFYSAPSLYIHHEDGVFRLAATDICMLYGAKSLVCLVDMDFNGEPQYALHSKENYLFVIGATSPRQDRYKSWCEQNALKLVIMDIPDPGEIE